MGRSLCQLRTEHISVVTSVVIHCWFLSASFKVHILCHKKKKCSVSVITAKLVSAAIGSRMEYSSEVRGKEESVYDKVAREFRELEKNADKYFDNLDAVEEMCYKAKKDAQRFRLKAEADKELLKREAAVRAKLYSSVLEMKVRPIKEEPTCSSEEKMPEAAENAQRLTVTGRVCRYVKIGCALVFDAVAAYGLFKLTQPYFF